MVGTRAVVAVAAFTTLVTLYSLSELHSLSVQHAEQEREDLLTISSAPSTQTGGKTVVIKPAEEHKQTQSAVVLPTITKAPVKASPKPAAHTANERKFFTYPNTELWGDVVAWGTQNKAETIEQCGNTCRDFKPAKPEDPDCNVFVWCGDKVACKENYQQCWLKHLSHPEASRPAKQGPEVFWTSGTMDVDINADPSNAKKTGSSESRRFHIITSAQGAAVHWQARIHYYWYKKQKSICEKAGGCEMGGFTRLLHSGAADDLMDEIPTIVVDPLPQDMVEHSWYVVLNRPYAFVQWVQKHKIPERFVLMSEPDHIFLRPIPNFMTGDRPAAFPFFYIEPAKAEHARITQKFTGQISRKQLEEIAPIGNSPTFMTWEDMQKTMPIWMNTSIAIFKDTEANQVWGWVQEMYGFTIAAYLAGIKKFDLFLNMMAQPPWDTNMNMTKNKPFYILHYTYGMDYKLTGEFTPGKIGAWRFDKRSYGGKPIPRNLGPPPVNMKNDLVRALINSFNEATDAIPCWTEYQEAGGKVPKECHEAPKHFLLEELNEKKAKEGGATTAGTTAKTSAT